VSIQDVYKALLLNVHQNKNIKENKEAPDKSWSVTIANQDTYNCLLPVIRFGGDNFQFEKYYK
jgi:hypothetical protein